MIKIYHNNRCSKYRLGVKFLEDSGKDFEIVKYLENIPTEAELTEIIKLLGITPMELVRKNEAVWKSDYKGKDLSDSQIIKAMVENPKLIERPIVIKADKGVVGRPKEKIAEIF